MDKQQSMSELRVEALGRYRDICGPDVNLVWGEGDINSPLAIFGEAPGGTEDRLGRPFVGQAGKLLGAELAAIGIDRHRAYISNVVKCRPVRIAGGRPSNRPPTAKEVSEWRDMLDRELSVISPKVTLCLGAVAASALIHPKFAMNAERGQWFDGPVGSKAIAAFHPAYVLRASQYDGGEVAELFRADLRMAVDAAFVGHH